MNVLARTHDKARLYIAHSSGPNEWSVPGQYAVAASALAMQTGFDHARWQAAMASDLRDLRQRPPMVLERHEIPAFTQKSLSRLLVVSALLGVSVFGAGTALAMRNGGKPARASDTLAMIPIEVSAVAQEAAVVQAVPAAPRPATPASAGAQARVAWTSSPTVIAALEPKAGPPPTAPLPAVAPLPRSPKPAASKPAKPIISTLY